MLAAEQARQWGSESDEAGRRQAWQLGQEVMRQGALGMGSDDTYNQAVQQQKAYEQQKKQALSKKQQLAKMQAEEDAADAAVAKGMGDLATFGLSKASDERCKENIKPARSEARAILQALKQSEEDQQLGAELGAQPGKAGLGALRREGPKKWNYRPGLGLGA
jgi:hypothetical protein